MELTNFYLALLLVSTTFLFVQLFVKQKQAAHILFALFCASIAIMATKELSGEAIGAYQYILGMGACVTCNGYWLLSRSLFREKNAILTRHICLAASIALLIMANQGYLFVNYTSLLSSSSNSFVKHILGELTVLLSSGVIMLSFWEGCRGYKKADKQDKAQRILFLITFGLAVSLSKLSQGLFSEATQYRALSNIAIILFVLTNTQILMLWRFKKANSSLSFIQAKDTVLQDKINTCNIAEDKIDLAEKALAINVEKLLIEQSLFLKTNLKVADIARELDVPEYKISRALRHSLCAQNFNQYVNELRIKHAKKLLADPDKQKWPVLVVGLESGFASVGPFTRTFKLLTGFTPNQYRQHQLTAEATI